MTVEQIEKFIDQHVKNKQQTVKISFKTRNHLSGIFIQSVADYDELKNKNFWRIVTSANLENYERSKDLSHSRMFNGTEFTKLSIQ
jgi:beta-xylosidase